MKTIERIVEPRAQTSFDHTRQRLANLWFTPGVPDEAVTGALVDYFNGIYDERWQESFACRDAGVVAVGIHSELETIAAFHRNRVEYPPTLGETRSVFMNYMTDDYAKELCMMGYSAKQRAVTMTIMHGLDKML